jgi:hypothetical protein
MYAYRLSRVEFNDGTELIPGSLTVLCGPNNVGKSRALRDIALFSTSFTQPPTVVIRAADYVLPETLDELCKRYSVERRFNERGNWSWRALVPELCDEFVNSGGTWPDDYQRMFSSKSAHTQRQFAHAFGQAMVAYLTTEHRLQLVKESPSASKEHQVANLLQALYAAGSSATTTVSDVVFRAFGSHIALDFTAPPTSLLRVGADFSHIPPDPRDARPLLLKYEKLDEQGDGLRAFVGIVVAALVVNRGLFLIDEPEAFLHPPQAFRIGEFLANQAGESKQLVMATHSVDFLRGLLSRTRDVTVIRIDRTQNQNTFSRLDPRTLENLASDPLLSSARVLDGLFYAGAVVVEADRDVRFYQSVFKKRFPDIDLHFVNADNKQTVPNIVKLYRDLGVKCCGVVDFDVLNDAHEFESIIATLAMDHAEKEAVLRIRGLIGMEAKEMPQNERFSEAATRIEALYRETQSQAQSLEDGLPKFLSELDGKCREITDAAKGWKELKRMGIHVLSEPLQAEFWKLYDICAKSGLLITPTGELESMLIEYGIERTTDKRAWITRALRLIPSIEADDVKNPWKFAKSINENIRS